MAKVTMYTKIPCPYCENAKRLFKDKNIAYDLIDLTERMDELEALKQKTGWRTVPMIFINDKLVGGYSDLRALDESGQLDEMVK